MRALKALFISTDLVAQCRHNIIQRFVHFRCSGFCTVQHAALLNHNLHGLAILFQRYGYGSIRVFIKDAVKLTELALHQFLKILSQVHFSANDLDVHTSTGFSRKKHKGMCFFHLRKKHILSERLGFHYSAYGFCRSLYLQYKAFEQKLQ